MSNKHSQPLYKNISLTIQCIHYIYIRLDAIPSHYQKYSFSMWSKIAFQSFAKIKQEMYFDQLKHICTL